MSCALILPPKPDLKCTGGKFNFKETTKYFRVAGQVKKQIELQYLAMPDSCDASCKKQLGEALAKIELQLDLLRSIFPKIFQKLKNLEDEMEHIGRQLLKELELFLTKLIITFLDQVISLIGILNVLNFPIPFLGSVTLIGDDGKPYQYSPKILDFFTKDGKSKIKAALRERQKDVEKFFASIDKQITDFFTGEWNIKAPDLNIEELWQKFINWIDRTLNDFINNIITKLIELIEKIVPLPIKLLLDPTKSLEKMFDDLWEKAKKQYQEIRDKLLKGDLADKVARELYNQAQKIIDTLIDTILSIPVPIFGTVGNVIGLAMDAASKKIMSKEEILAKLNDGWKKLMNDIRNFFQRDWFKKIFDWLYKTITSVVLNLLKAVPIIGAFIKALDLIMQIITGKIDQCTAMDFIEKTTGIPIRDICSTMYNSIPSCMSVEYKEGGYMPQTV